MKRGQWGLVVPPFFIINHQVSPGVTAGTAISAIFVHAAMVLMGAGSNSPLVMQNPLEMPWRPWRCRFSHARHGVNRYGSRHGGTPTRGSPGTLLALPRPRPRGPHHCPATYPASPGEHHPHAPRGVARLAHSGAPRKFLANHRGLVRLALSSFPGFTPWTPLSTTST